MARLVQEVDYLVALFSLRLKFSFLVLIKFLFENFMRAYNVLGRTHLLFLSHNTHQNLLAHLLQHLMFFS